MNSLVCKLNNLPIYKFHEYIEKFGIDDTRFLISVGNQAADLIFAFPS